MEINYLIDMKDLADKLLELEANSEASRKLWQEKTKPYLITELTRIKNSLELDLSVDVHDAIINLETVALSFKNKPSGLSYNETSITNKQNGKSGPITKFGGTLNFSMVYYGLVVVWIAYPYVIEAIENKENIKDIESLEQEDIDEKKISGIVTKFLEEMIEWQSGKILNESKIGFRLPGEEYESNETEKVK